ncbi:Aspartate--tRNA ligase 2, cytoplasmic [Arachis hypogaea]|nr:Aspartate--tRNA ligase 2, cytoplasmic [Arachis hypogaea]
MRLILLIVTSLSKSKDGSHEAGKAPPPAGHCPCLPPNRSSPSTRTTPSLETTATSQWSSCSRRPWTRVVNLEKSLEGKHVLTRARVQAIRRVGKKMALLVVREKGFTVHCLVQEQRDLVSVQMVKYAAALSRESVIDVEGLVSVPSEPIKGATQQVVLVNGNLEDAARSEAEIEKALQAGEQPVRVNQDTRLKSRVFELRTPANQGIFRIQSQVGNAFRKFLSSEGFVEIYTSKLIALLNYKGHPVCRAESPHLHKQMPIYADVGRVFEIGSAFRVEDSLTPRHLCDVTGLDVEMEIMEHYDEVMDIVDRLFVSIFDSLNQNCKKELEAVALQYPFEPLKYLCQTLRLTYEEGVQMLKDAGVEIETFGDLNTEAERKLGELVLERYGTEFYILYRYPLAGSSFYTMPCYDNSPYSNSFNVFIRGEQIISGAQHVHDAEMLEKRAKACGIDVKKISLILSDMVYHHTVALELVWSA